MESLYRRIVSNRNSNRNWRLCKVLIIDEISMIDGHLFDLIEQLARKLKGGQEKPFGGIQVICCGDFFQLPPVNVKTFVFESSCWSSVMSESIELRTVFRQKDKKFIDILNELRLGIVSPKTTQLLRSLSHPLNPPNGITPTRLYCRNIDVTRMNNNFLKNLPGKSLTFTAESTGQQL